MVFYVRRASLAVLVVCVGLVSACERVQPGGPAIMESDPSANSCPAVLMLTDEDTQTDVCVTKGGTVSVTLLAGDGQDWLPIQVSGSALTAQPAASPSDGTTATFRATAPGTVDITSSRNLCPPPSPGQAACHSLQAFKVTVSVR